MLGNVEPMVAADLDLVNMFGNIEWPSIREALDKHFVAAQAWTRWQHKSTSVTMLPSGVEFETNRGAEQGDVLGTIQSALSLGSARATHFATSALNRTSYEGACDEWYIDDGQLVIRPHLLDPWLRSFDAAISTYGATLEAAKQRYEMNWAYRPLELVAGPPLALLPPKSCHVESCSSLLHSVFCVFIIGCELR